MSWRPLTEVLPVLRPESQGPGGMGAADGSNEGYQLGYGQPGAGGESTGAGMYQAANAAYGGGQRGDGHSDARAQEQGAPAIDAGKLLALPGAEGALLSQAPGPDETAAHGGAEPPHGQAQMPEYGHGQAARHGQAQQQARAPGGGAKSVKDTLFGSAAAHAEAAERVREQAKSQGYEEGAALARAEQEALAMRYRGAIEDLVSAREQTMQACEADLVRLAHAIAREVLQSDLSWREPYAVQMATYAAQTLGGQQTVTLRMHPNDAKALRAAKPELVARGDVQLVEDDALEVGGVVAQGGRGRIDASIETRLAQMREKLLSSTAVEGS